MVHVNLFCWSDNSIGCLLRGGKNIGLTLLLLPFFVSLLSVYVAF